MPCNIVSSQKLGDYEDAELYGAMDCIECGSCSFVCPARIPIVQYIRIAKGEIRKKGKR